MPTEASSTRRSVDDTGEDEADPRVAEFTSLLRNKTREIEELRCQLSSLQDLLRHRPPIPVQDVGDTPNVEIERNCSRDDRETFEKVPGTANDSGHLYEVKMVLLTFLRCLHTARPFRLAANLKGVGKFDDVVVQREDVPGRMCVQLKHRGSSIRPSEMLAFSGKFSILTYFISYRDDMSDEEDCQLVFHTNADVPRELCHPSRDTDLLSTSDNGLSFTFCAEDTDVYQFPKRLQLYKEFLQDLDQRAEESSEEDLAWLVENQISNFEPLNRLVPFRQRLVSLKKEPTREQIQILLGQIQQLGDLSQYHSFLNRFKIYYRQAGEVKLTEVIKAEVRKQVGVVECDSAVSSLLDKTKLWWKNKEGYYLTERDNMWLDTVVDMFKTLSEDKVRDISGMNIRVKKVEELRRAIFKNRVLHVLVDGEHTSLAACKVFQALEGDTTNIYTTLEGALAKKESVLGAWRSRWGRVLVLEADKITEFQNFLNALRDTLNLNGDARLVVITDVNDLTTTNHFRTLEGTEWSDRTNLTDLTDDVRNYLLERDVIFQGSIIPLGVLIGGNEELMRSVDDELVLRLVRGETIRLGNDLPETIDYFIPRTLTRQNTSFFPEEVQDRAIIVVGEPGMGKSTLLTSLGREIKRDHPGMWVVRVNLADFTSYFDAADGTVNDKAIIRFLKTVVNLRTGLDQCLFKHCWQTTGRMVLLVDGYDEICPIYEEMVSLYMNTLLLTGIKKVWITSRNLCKSSIESTMSCEAFRLDSFKEEDQRSFLRKIWLKEDINPDLLDTFIDKILTVVSSSMNDTERSFMGIPLQTMFIAEMFETNLREYHKTQHYLSPFRFDLLDMYEAFFRKKCAIDLEEKRGYDMTRKGVRDDCLSLSRKAEEIHKLCALVTLLPPADLGRIHDKTIGGRVKKFLGELQLGIDLIGVVHSVVDTRPVFIHRTFAEYFFAKWLSDNYQHNRTLMVKLFHNPTFYMVFRILNRILSRGHPLHMSVINNDLATFKLLLNTHLDVKDAGGRTALHLSAGFVQDATFTRLLLEGGARTDLSDNVLQWNALLYADGAGMWGSIEQLLCRGNGYASDLIFTKENIRNEGYIKSAVRTCCEEGLKTCLRFFVKEGISVDLALDQHLNRPLHVASGEDILDLLIRSGGDVNARTVEGRTPLHVAARDGNVALVRYFLEREMDESDVEKSSGTRRLFNVLTGGKDKIMLEKAMSQQRDLEGRTALEVAAQHGHQQVVEYLREVHLAVDDFLRGRTVEDPQLLCAVKYLVEERGADVQGADNHGSTPLHHAARGGKVSVVEYLCEKGASPMMHERYGDTPLHVAAYCGHLQVVRYFINEREAHPDALGWHDFTPFRYALAVNNKEMARALVTLGAKTDLRDRSGDTALNDQARRGRIGAVTYLVEECGNSPRELGKDDTTPFHNACANGHLLVAEYLRDKGVRPNVKNAHGDAALHAAAGNGKLDTVSYLLDTCSATPDTVGRFGETALHRACLGGHLEVVAFLADRGASQDLADRVGNLPVHHAVTARQIHVVKFLLSNPYRDPNCPGVKKRTPLHIACTVGDLDMVKFLVERPGIKLNLPNADKETPLDLARKYRHQDIVKLLQMRMKTRIKIRGLT